MNKKDMEKMMEMKDTKTDRQSVIAMALEKAKRK